VLAQQSQDHDPDYASQLRLFEAGELDNSSSDVIDDDDDDDDSDGGAAAKRKRGKKTSKKKPPASIWPMVWRYYWGCHQRFFRSLCISCKVFAFLEFFYLAPTASISYYSLSLIFVCDPKSS